MLVSTLASLTAFAFLRPVGVSLGRFKISARTELSEGSHWKRNQEPSEGSHWKRNQEPSEGSHWKRNREGSHSKRNQEGSHWKRNQEGSHLMNSREPMERSYSVKTWEPTETYSLESVHHAQMDYQF